MSWDIMKAIVQGGGNLIIEDTASCSWDFLRDLAHIAKRSGARITVSESHVSWNVARELVNIAGGQITIKCGLSNIKANP